MTYLKHVLFVSFISLLLITTAYAGDCFIDGDVDDCRAKSPQDSNALNELGTIYYTGRGVAQDYREAFKFWKRAAQQGNAASQLNLGHIYDVGEGVAQSNQEALKWFKKAAEQGDAFAEEQVKIIEEKIAKAAQQGNAGGLEYLQDQLKQAKQLVRVKKMNQAEKMLNDILKATQGSSQREFKNLNTRAGSQLRQVKGFLKRQAQSAQSDARRKKAMRCRPFTRFNTVSKLDAAIKRANLTPDECSHVWKYREKLVAQGIKTKKAKEDRDKKALEKRKRWEAEAQEKIRKQVEQLYQSGLIKKLSPKVQKKEMAKRRSNLEKLGLNYDVWLKNNNEFESTDKGKIETVKLFKQMNTIYMMVKMCAKNQGEYEIISDISKVKKQMKVFSLIMPLGVDGDVVWETAAGSALVSQFAQLGDLYSPRDFAEKVGAQCQQQQSGLTMMYMQITKSFGLKMKKIKKDF